MSVCRAVFVVGAVACAAWVAGVSSAQETETRPIPELIRRLDADTYEARQSASNELLKIGEPALAALEAAASDRGLSAEARRRAEQAARQIKLAQIRREAVKLADLLAQADLARRGKFDAARLDAILERLTILVADATGNPRLALPKAAELTVAAPGGNVSSKTIIIGDNVKETSLSDSIVLARTSAQFTSVRNSVVITGIAGDATSVRGSLIIAGQELRASSLHESIALCGGDFHASFPRQSVVGAAGKLDVSIPDGCILLNSRPAREVNIPGREPARVVESAGIDLKLSERAEPLKGLLRLTEVSALRTFALFRRQGGDGEYVARIGKPLIFPDGKPMPELAGWQLDFCGRQYAVFSKGDEQTVVRPEPGP
jgi:hypothetical protein